MTNEEAKKILALYRPGTSDRNDPAFKEALDRAKAASSQVPGQEKPDPELGRWFKDHCSSYQSIRAKFLDIEPPAGLKDRILAGYKAPPSRIIPFPGVVLLSAAAALALCLSLTALYWRSHGRQDDFNTYRTRMARTALEPYSMALESRDFRSINTFLAQREAPADYKLPEGIAKAQPVGCAVLHWQGEPVSMICFHSGQPLPSGDKSDLWLFVIDQSSLREAPGADSPVVARVLKLITATWTREGKTYVLATAGDEASLRKFL